MPIITTTPKSNRGVRTNTARKLHFMSQLKTSLKKKPIVTGSTSQIGKKKNVNFPSPVASNLSTVAAGSNNSPSNTYHTSMSSNPVYFQPKTFKPIAFAGFVNKVNQWFVILDQDFEGEQITDEFVKFRIAKAALSKHLPTQEVLSDCFVLDGSSSPYQQLKLKVISRLGQSNKAKWNQLEAKHELGSRKPSQLLAEIRTFAPTDAPESRILDAFLRSLPVPLATQLERDSYSMSMDELAVLADSLILRYSTGSNNETFSIETPASNPKVPQVLTEVQDDKSNDEQSKVLQKLCEVLELFAVSSTRPNTYRSKGQTKTKVLDSQVTQKEKEQRRRSQPKPGDPDYLCWYHWRWGKKSENCDASCCMYEQFLREKNSRLGTQ